MGISTIEVNLHKNGAAFNKIYKRKYGSREWNSIIDITEEPYDEMTDINKIISRLNSENKKDQKPGVHIVEIVAMCAASVVHIQELYSGFLDSTTVPMCCFVRRGWGGFSLVATRAKTAKEMLVASQDDNKAQVPLIVVKDGIGWRSINHF